MEIMNMLLSSPGTVRLAICTLSSSSKCRSEGDTIYANLILLGQTERAINTSSVGTFWNLAESLLPVGSLKGVYSH